MKDNRLAVSRRIQSWVRVVVAVLFAGCGPPFGATSTERPSPVPSEVRSEPSATIPIATPAPSELRADLVGKLNSARDGDNTCVWLVDDDGATWEIKWPEGHRIRWEGERAILASQEDGDIAISGDRIALQGYGGWYVDDQVSIKFDVEVVDPVAAEQGSASPRRKVLDAWAAANGLEVMSGAREIGWWRLQIIDGTPEREKAAELATLPEVMKAIPILIGSYPIGEGSYCEPGGRFTAESITFVEGAAHD
jgi:hypothetical protein